MIKKLLFGILMFALLANAICADNIITPSYFLNETKNTTDKLVTATISFNDYNIIHPDPESTATHYYYLKIKNEDSKKIELSSKKEDFSFIKLTLENIDSLNVYNISDKQMFSIDESQDAKQQFLVNYYNITFNKIDSKNDITLQPGETKEYLIVFDTPRFAKDQFNVTITNGDVNLQLDPDVSACGAISTYGATYTLNQSLSHSSFDCITISNSDITLDCNGFSITGNNTVNTESMFANAKSNLTIKNCILNSAFTGIFFFSSGDNNQIINTSIDNCSSAGISLSAQTNASIRNTTIRNTNSGGLNANAYAIYLLTSKDSNITNTTIINSTSTSNGSIQISGSTALDSSTNNQVTNCYITGTGKSYIFESLSTYSNIAYNTLSGSPSFSAIRSSISNYSKINSNIIEHNTNDQTAVVLSNSQFVLASNNSISALLHYAVSISGGTNNITFNNISGENGIYVSSSDSNRFVSNKVYNLTDSSILLHTTANSDLNTFLNNTLTGGKNWVNDSGSGNAYNDSTSGNRYYFANGSGAWVTFNLLDSNSDGWADGGTARPFNTSTVTAWFGPNGTDWFPYKEVTNPTMSEISITPESPTTTDTLIGTANATDPDGNDVFYNCSWFKDGALFSSLQYPSLLPTSTVSTKVPGTAATADAYSATTGDWTNANNILADDGSNAVTSYTDEGSGYGNTYQLKATNFGFDLPSGSTIDGILATAMDTSTSCDGGGTIVDYDAKLIVGGTVNGTNKATGNTNVVPYGGATDLWGQTGLTEAQVEASNFGWAIGYTITYMDFFETCTVSIDAMNVTVFYTYNATQYTAQGVAQNVGNISSASLTAGDDWSLNCSATSNASQTSDWLSTANVTILASNTVPNTPIANITPTAAYRSSTLIMNCTGDDNDTAETMAYYYTVLKNDVLAASGYDSNSSNGYNENFSVNVFNVSGSNLSVGDTWKIVCLANDLTANSTANATSNTVTILNIIPTQGTPILNSSNLLNTTSTNITVYNISTQDTDSDIIKNIIDWRNNDTSIALANLPFEGGSNTTYTRDYSKNNFSSVFSGNLTWSNNTGHDGRGAYFFDGTGDQINLTNDSRFNFQGDFSVSAWIKFTDQEGDWVGIVTKWNPAETQASWGLFHDGGADRLIFITTSNNVYNSSRDAVDTSAIVPDGWYFIVGTYNATSRLTSLYINGTLKNSVTPTLSVVSNSTASVLVSGYSTDGTKAFNGTIDDVGIWNRTLTQQEITNMFYDKTESLSSGELNQKDSWQACLTPNDGFVDSAITTCSNSLMINSKPTQGTPILNSSLGTNYTDENLTVYNISSYDFDNSTINNTIDWRLNGNSIAIANYEFRNGDNATYAKDFSTVNGQLTGYNTTFNTTTDGAVIFDGNSSMVSNNTFTITTNQDITINARYKIDLVMADNDVMTIQNGYYLFDHAGNYVYTQLCSGNKIAAPAPVAGQWVDMTLVRNGSNCYLYVNGSYYSTVASLATAVNGNLYLGRRGLAAQAFKGNIDYLRVYNNSLTANQIALLSANTTQTLHSDFTNHSDVYQACVTPNDGSEYGDTTCSNELTTLDSFSPEYSTVYQINNATASYNVSWYKHINGSGSGNCNTTIHPDGTVVGVYNISDSSSIPYVQDYTAINWSCNLDGTNYSLNWTTPAPLLSETPLTQNASVASNLSYQEANWTLTVTNPSLENYSNVSWTATTDCPAWATTCSDRNDTIASLASTNTTSTFYLKASGDAITETNYSYSQNISLTSTTTVQFINSTTLVTNGASVAWTSLNYSATDIPSCPDGFSCNSTSGTVSISSLGSSNIITRGSGDSLSVNKIGYSRNLSLTQTTDEVHINTTSTITNNASIAYTGISYIASDFTTCPGTLVCNLTQTSDIGASTSISLYARGSGDAITDTFFNYTQNTSALSNSSIVFINATTALLNTIGVVFSPLYYTTTDFANCPATFTCNQTGSVTFFAYGTTLANSTGSGDPITVAPYNYTQNTSLTSNLTTQFINATSVLSNSAELDWTSIYVNSYTDISNCPSSFTCNVSNSTDILASGTVSVYAAGSGDGISETYYNYSQYGLGRTVNITALPLNTSQSALGGAVWANTSNVLTQDGIKTAFILEDVDPADDATSDFLRMWGYNFSIPLTANVTQVKYQVALDVLPGISSDFWDRNVSLMRDGAIIGENKASGGTYDNAWLVEYTYNFTSPSLTPNDINDIDFGAVFAGELNRPGGSMEYTVGEIDYLKLNVFYTEKNLTSNTTNQLVNSTTYLSSSADINFDNVSYAASDFSSCPETFTCNSTGILNISANRNTIIESFGSGDNINDTMYNYSQNTSLISNATTQYINATTRLTNGNEINWTLPYTAGDFASCPAGFGAVYTCNNTGTTAILSLNTTDIFSPGVGNSFNNTYYNYTQNTSLQSYVSVIYVNATTNITNADPINWLNINFSSTHFANCPIGLTCNTSGTVNISPSNSTLIFSPGTGDGITESYVPDNIKMDRAKQDYIFFGNTTLYINASVDANSTVNLALNNVWWNWTEPDTLASCYYGSACNLSINFTALSEKITEVEYRIDINTSEQNHTINYNPFMYLHERSYNINDSYSRTVNNIGVNLTNPTGIVALYYCKGTNCAMTQEGVWESVEYNYTASLISRIANDSMSVANYVLTWEDETSSEEDTAPSGGGITHTIIDITPEVPLPNYTLPLVPECEAGAVVSRICSSSNQTVLCSCSPLNVWICGECGVVVTATNITEIQQTMAQNNIALVSSTPIAANIESITQGLFKSTEFLCYPVAPSNYTIPFTDSSVNLSTLNTRNCELQSVMVMLFAGVIPVAMCMFSIFLLMSAYVLYAKVPIYNVVIPLITIVIGIYNWMTIVNTILKVVNIVG